MGPVIDPKMRNLQEVIRFLSPKCVENCSDDQLLYICSCY